MLCMCDSDNCNTNAKCNCGKCIKNREMYEESFEDEGKTLGSKMSFWKTSQFTYLSMLKFSDSNLFEELRDVVKSNQKYALNFSSAFENLNDERVLHLKGMMNDEVLETVLQDTDEKDFTPDPDIKIRSPKFFFDTERSETGNPKVSIIFPNGKEDNVILSKFEINENNRLEDVENCRYVGHLEHEPEACVAMTGCFGKENVEFTILSEHSEGSGSYQLNLNGSVKAHVLDMSLMNMVYYHLSIILNFKVRPFHNSRLTSSIDLTH